MGIKNILLEIYDVFGEIVKNIFIKEINSILRSLFILFVN